MRPILKIFLLNLIVFSAWGQDPYELVFPDSINWRQFKENKEIAFQLSNTTPEVPVVYSLEGPPDLNYQFDSLGRFCWKPSFDLVDRVEESKDLKFIFQADWKDGNRYRKTVTFTVHHVNRPPIVEELPVFYVKQSSQNKYQIPTKYVYDPDGDPVVAIPISSQMPEGTNLSSLGVFTWNTSRSQFNALRNKPLTIEFMVQDQPHKAETKGSLKIAQTQLDLPPEIITVPGDSTYIIKEDETLNIKLYISDPNGDDNVRDVGFVASDFRVSKSLFKENTPVQYEFTWTPGYDFVDDVQKTLPTDVIFYALDNSNNRVEKKIKITVLDAENMAKKDAHLYDKYRALLSDGTLLINQLDDNQKKLNSDYKKAKKGKKNRSILNASLGAATGFSPIVLEADQAKIVSGVGGTTVLTLGTLEATEVIGRSKENILEKIKIGIDIRNKVQSNGDEFARKYTLKSSRRNSEFDKDIEKLRTTIHDQRIVLLELEAYRKNAEALTDKQIKKVFVDFAINEE